MAQQVIKNTRLTLMYETGLDEKGEPIFKGKSYSSIRMSATPDQLHQAAVALSGLCAHVLSSIERTDNHDVF
ncbi:DUF1659 domain-containing protein [Mesobacillus maritimus]|uniref:DUF1659 domain-containing protein n=1 Tax=Mesobacillus maritimus TaxID=1643336 RepID=UPI00203BA6EB|nr:DUF1659 domain-containing protein [Mesobacillus maritimus]MCM3672075.1 DUF1659 domain-containing protein [Mesobacillus maritimus]